MTLYKRIGSRIRQAREALGISQEELGRLLGYSPTAISYFETGTRKLKIEDLQKIAQVLEKPLDFFLQEEPEDELVAIQLRAQQELSPRAAQDTAEFLQFLRSQGLHDQPKLDLRGLRPYAAAYRLLELQGIDEPPVPVQDVAEAIDIPVIEWQFPDEVSAMLIRSRRFTVIGVNQDHPETRKRFSIAHELGHAVLGHDAEKIYIEFAGLELPPERGERREEDEREANWFAADLLMPKAWVEEDWKELGDVTAIAERYGVSEQAMWIRLQQFDLVQGVAA